MTKRPENRTQAVHLLESSAGEAPRLHPLPDGRRDDAPRRAQLGHLQPPAEGPHRLPGDRDQRRRRQHHHRPVSLPGERGSRQGDHALHQQPRRRGDQRPRDLRHHAVRPLPPSRRRASAWRPRWARCSSPPAPRAGACALPNARVMIHQPLGGARGQATDIEIQASEIRHSKEVITDILANATGKPRTQIHKDIDRDFYLSAAAGQGIRPHRRRPAAPQEGRRRQEGSRALIRRLFLGPPSVTRANRRKLATAQSGGSKLFAARPHSPHREREAIWSAGGTITRTAT